MLQDCDLSLLQVHPKVRGRRSFVKKEKKKKEKKREKRSL
jgi:hypothetical protein